MEFGALSRATERLNSRLRAAQDQRVDVVGAFVGVDRFQVQHVPDDITSLAWVSRSARRTNRIQSAPNYDLTAS